MAPDEIDALELGTCTREEKVDNGTGCIEREFEHGGNDPEGNFLPAIRDSGVHEGSDVTVVKDCKYRIETGIPEIDAIVIGEEADASKAEDIYTVLNESHK